MSSGHIDLDWAGIRLPENGSADKSAKETRVRLARDWLAAGDVAHLTEEKF